MNLTAGSVLQHGKYVIDVILSQGDFDTTYQATHTYLDQIVVIKTLNESLCQRPNFTQLQQQFTKEARRLAKRPSTHSARVLDLFKEAGRAFLVIEHVPGQPPVELNFAKNPQPLQPEVPRKLPTPSTNGFVPASGPVSTQPTTAQPTIPEPSTTEFTADEFTADSPPTPPKVDDATGLQDKGLQASSQLAASYQPQMNGTAPKDAQLLAINLEPSDSPVVPPITPGVPVNGHSSVAVKKQKINQTRSVSGPWLPWTLVATSVLAASAGAGAALSLRLSNPGESAVPTLFRAEQSFPPLPDWPQEEDPDSLPSRFSTDSPEIAPVESNPTRQYADPIRSSAQESEFTEPDSYSEPETPPSYDPEPLEVSPEPPLPTESYSTPSPLPYSDFIPEVVPLPTPDLEVPAPTIYEPQPPTAPSNAGKQAPLPSVMAPALGSTNLSPPVVR